MSKKTPRKVSVKDKDLPAQQAEKVRGGDCASGTPAKGKPHPEPFLVAAAKLGVPPQSCLVFEDTEMGIQSATAAGMASVKIPQPCERS